MAWFPVGLSTLLMPSAFVLPPLDIDDHGDDMFEPLSWQTELMGDALSLRGYQSLDVIRMTPSLGLYDDFAASGFLSPSAPAVMMPDVTHWIPTSEIVGSSPSPRYEQPEPWWTQQGTTPPSATSTLAPHPENITTKREPSPDIPLLTPPRTPSPAFDSKHHILTGGGHDYAAVKSEFDPVLSATAEWGYPSPLLSPTSTICGSVHDDASSAVTADRDCDLGLDTYYHEDHGAPLQLFGPSFLVVHKPHKRSSSPTSCVALAPPFQLSGQGLLPVEPDIKDEDDAHDAPFALTAPTRKRKSARMDHDEPEAAYELSRKRKVPAAGCPSASAALTMDTMDSADGARNHDDDDRPLKKLKKEIPYDDANHVLSHTPPPLRIETDLDPRSETAPGKVASFGCIWGMCPLRFPRRDLLNRHVDNDHDLRRCSSCGSYRGTQLSCASGLCVAPQTEGDAAAHSQPIPKQRGPSRCLWGMCPQVYPRRDLRDRHIDKDH